MIYLFDEVKAKFFALMKSHKNVISNYVSQDLSNNDIELFENENGVLVFAYDKEYKVYKVYFMVDSFQTLDSLLLQASWKQSSSLEILSKNEINDNFTKLFEKYGFFHFKTLHKMSCLKKNSSKSTEQCEYANMNDLPTLKDIFDEEFNKYSENLPSSYEIERAIVTKSIIKLTENQKMIGFLWFDKKTVVTELRYLFVNKEYRGKKLSKMLMEQYFYLTKDVRKKQLWVLDDNDMAINLYKKFSYEFENLKDTIFKMEVK